MRMMDVPGGMLRVRGERPTFCQHQSMPSVHSWYVGCTLLGRNIDFWTSTVDFDFDQG